MYTSIIIGFDVREMWLDPNSQWTDTVRNKYLLRQTGLEKPLSVDSYTWYSVFSELLEPRLWVDKQIQVSFVSKNWNIIFSEDRKLDYPEDFRYRSVSRNLYEMRKWIEKTWGNLWKPCYEIVVVEILKDMTDINLETELRGVAPLSHTEIDEDWTLLGYDVADYDLYTGLFQGEIDQEESAKLRRSWSKYLNSHHLFDDPEKAFEYISVANRRYPSHTPYYVYALYLVKQHIPILDT